MKESEEAETGRQAIKMVGYEGNTVQIMIEFFYNGSLPEIPTFEQCLEVLRLCRQFFDMFSIQNNNGQCKAGACYCIHLAIRV